MRNEWSRSFDLLAEVACVKAVALVGLLAPPLLHDGDIFSLQAEGYGVNLTWSASRAAWESTSHPLGPEHDEFAAPSQPAASSKKGGLLDVDPNLLIMRVGPGAPLKQVFQVGFRALRPTVSSQGPPTQQLAPKPGTQGSTSGYQPVSVELAQRALNDDLIASATGPGTNAMSAPELSNRTSNTTAQNIAALSGQQAQPNNLAGLGTSRDQTSEPRKRQQDFPEGCCVLPPGPASRPGSAMGQGPGPPHLLQRTMSNLEKPCTPAYDQVKAASISVVDEAQGPLQPMAIRVVCNNSVLPVRQAWRAVPPAPPAGAQATQPASPLDAEGAQQSALQQESWRCMVDFEPIALAAVNLTRPTHMAAQVQLWGCGKQLDAGFVMVLLMPLSAWFSWAPMVHPLVLQPQQPAQPQSQPQPRQSLLAASAGPSHAPLVPHRAALATVQPRQRLEVAAAVNRTAQNLARRSQTALSPRGSATDAAPDAAAAPRSPSSAGDVATVTHADVLPSAQDPGLADNATAGPATPSNLMTAPYRMSSEYTRP